MRRPAPPKGPHSAVPGYRLHITMDGAYLRFCAAAQKRKSFDSLHALVRDHLELDVLAGHLFVFTSRRKDRVKILYWDRDGLAVWSKRLEGGTYAVPFEDGARERQQEITAQELGALLSGIDLSVAKRRKRYRRAG